MTMPHTFSTNMDTNDTQSDIPFDLPEVIGALRKTLLEERKTMTKHFDRLVAKTMDKLECATDYELPYRAATHAECDQMARNVTARCATTFEKLDKRRLSVVENFKRQERLQIKMIRMVRGHLQKQGLSEAEKRRCVWYNRSMGVELAFFKKTFVQHSLDYAYQKTARLQTGLQQLVEDQTEDTKRWFHDKYLAKYGDHINSKRSDVLKPIVEVTEKRFDQLKRFFLPPELMQLVYSFCDLESCVALRQVNSLWFHGFQKVDLELKMASRNPWIQPGDGDLKTWTDCVLVFVARLQSPKWTATDKPSSLHLQGRSEAKRAVVATELGDKEKLPVDFTSLVGDWGCEIGVCNHYHTIDNPEEGGQNDDYIMNPWTLEHKNNHEGYEIVSADEEKTVIRYKGMEITLPPNHADLIVPHDPADRFQRHVTLLQSFIAINLTNGTIIMFPRDKPHFHHSFSTDIDDNYVTPFELNGILVLECVNPSKSIYQFFFVDFRRKTGVLIKDLPPIPFCAPVAAHNGLIWWKQEYTTMVPTFMDLEQPDKMFYRADRVIFHTTKHPSTQGDRSHGWSKYMIGRSEISECVELVDLDTRIVTTVSPLVSSSWPTNAEEARIYVGFQNGRFCARAMDPYSQGDTWRRVLEAHGVQLGSDSESD